MKKFEVYQDGLDIYIKIPNAGKDAIDLLATLLDMEDAIKQLESLQAEEEPEEEPLVSGERYFPNKETNTPKFSEGRYAGHTALEALYQDGPVALGEIASQYKVLRQKKEDPQFLRDILSDIKIYLNEKCREGYDATELTGTQIKEILTANQNVWKNTLKEIVEKSGSASFSAFLKEADTLILAGALTKCMNTMHESYK